MLQRNAKTRAKWNPRDLLALGKPTITATAVVTAMAGFVLGGGVAGLALAAVLVGTASVVASANAFNMVLERRSDALMRRTRGRPLPAGRLSTRAATVAATLSGVGGLVLLGVGTNALTAALAAAALAGYAFVYTPLKRVTPAALVVGAIPGAAPPLLGWTGATGRIGSEGVILFLILFLWQIPHFLAIAIRCREDYARGGIRAVSVVRGDDVARRLALAYASLLLPVSLLLWGAGAAGDAYGIVAAALGMGMVLVAVQALRSATPQWDGRLFFTSLVYLPALMLALVVDTVLLGP